MSEPRKSTRFETGQIVMTAVYSRWLTWLKDHPKHGEDYTGSTAKYLGKSETGDDRKPYRQPTADCVDDIKKILHDCVYDLAELAASDVEKRVLFNGFSTLCKAAYTAYDAKASIKAEIDKLVSGAGQFKGDAAGMVSFTKKLGVPLAEFAEELAKAVQAEQAEQAKAESEASDEATDEAKQKTKA